MEYNLRLPNLEKDCEHRIKIKGHRFLEILENELIIQQWSPWIHVFLINCLQQDRHFYNARKDY